MFTHFRRSNSYYPFKNLLDVEMLFFDIAVANSQAVKKIIKSLDKIK